MCFEDDYKPNNETAKEIAAHLERLTMLSSLLYAAPDEETTNA